MRMRPRGKLICENITSTVAEVIGSMSPTSEINEKAVKNSLENA